MSSRCPGARSSTSSTPPRSPTACARSTVSCTWRPGSIRSSSRSRIPDAWRENDGLRADASKILVDASIAAGVAAYVQPTVTFVYPPDGQVSEDTPIGGVLPILRSALVAEQQTERFAGAGGRGVVLQFGLLDGPGTGNDQPVGDFGATLHVDDAGRALLSALSSPAVCTTSVVTGSAFRPSASPRLPDGIRSDEARPQKPVRAAAVSAPPRRSASASECLGRRDGESRSRGWVSRGCDHQRGRGHHARL